MEVNMLSFFSKSDWCLVADGSKALVLMNKGSQEKPNLVTERVLTLDNPPNRDHNSDRPGRMFDHSAHHKSALEPTDFHQRAEDLFMKKIAEQLHVALKADLFSRLVIAAPPDALGVLRQEMSEDLKKVVVAEFNKNWTNIPVAEIYAVVTEELKSEK
jgi:protein required for attachment to host cells